MSRRYYTFDQRRSALDDYHDTGDTITAVARRHGVSRCALTEWIDADDGVELTDGQWVTVGAIKKWVPNPTALPVVDEPDPPTLLPRDLIACPTCLAKMDERCEGMSRGRSHSARLVKRVCSCGDSLRPGEPMCGLCRVEQERGAA